MPIHVTTRGKPKEKGRTTAVQKKEGRRLRAVLGLPHAKRGGYPKYAAQEEEGEEGRQQCATAIQRKDSRTKDAQNGPGGRKGRPNEMIAEIRSLCRQNYAVRTRLGSRVYLWRA
ncbi:hypothetical protein D6I95_07710 [Alcaligenes faecalis]|nr:hypothetical protein D6I95_07710 [Alcaligenes faecalis]